MERARPGLPARESRDTNGAIMLALRTGLLALLPALLLVIAAAGFAAAEEPPGETVPLPPERPTVPAPDHEAPVATRAGDDELVLTTETPLVKSGQPATFSLYGPETFLRGALGRYVLRDEFGRTLAAADIRIADLPYSEGKPRQIQVAIEHPLARRLTLEFSIARPEGRQVELSASFAMQLPPADSGGWDGWINLVSSPPKNGAWDGLRGLSIAGSVQYRLHPARREALRKGGAYFYVENVSRQMLSRYHTEPGLWDKTLTAMAADASSRAPRCRDPSLCSQEFAEAFAKELKAHAEAYSKDSPLFYSLASEPSMTRLAAPADFDFSPAALTEFQRWLERDVYGTLPALNTSWGTNFTAWTDVLPMTTDEARLRLNDGVMTFGPWVDFRDFLDHTFARILREGGDYLRKTDPGAKAGITGAMGAFAFGGWDWSRLSQALDVVEAYDTGSARALWRDLAPGKPALAIVPAPRDDKPGTIAGISRTLWNFALEGGPRGLVLWNDDAALLDTEGKPTPPAAALTPLLAAVSGEAGTVLAHSRRTADVAVLYSPASIRLTWLLEADRLHGARWIDAWGRDSGGERRESPQLRLRESWTKLLDDAGMNWKFISTRQLEKRDVINNDNGIKTIVLPRTLCISDLEADALKQFVQNGGKLIADACCGRFDEHGRLRKKPALDEIFGIDSFAEPFFAEPMNPLEPVKAPRDWPAESAAMLGELAPVFSDKIKPAAGLLSRADYRDSPVLATAAHSVFLNLDLTDYLRWRLHPDLPRARATLDAVLKVALQERRDASAFDWAATKLPVGTRIATLEMGAGASRIIALMRNPQARLHELGTEAEGNWAFEKPEAFTLALRQPAFVRRIFPAGDPNANLNVKAQDAVKAIEGTLDPAAPLIFAIRSDVAKPPTLSGPAQVKPGDAVDLKIAADAAAPRIYGVSVKGPDGTERPWYGKTVFAPEGSAAHSFPTALNDPLGAWTITVRDLLNGVEASRPFNLAAPEAKP